MPGSNSPTYIAYGDGQVFAVSGDASVGHLTALNATDGRVLWTTTLPGADYFTAQPTVSGGVVYVGGTYSNGTLFAVDAASGKLLWTQTVEYGMNSVPAVTRRGVYVAYPCHIYDFAPQTGTPAWTYDSNCYGGGGYAPVFHRGKLYVTNETSTLSLVTYVMDANTGKVLSTLAGGGSMPAMGAQQGYFLVAGAVTAIDLHSTQTIWSYTPPVAQVGQIDYGRFNSDPILINDKLLLITTDSGFLFAFDTASGDIIEIQNLGAALVPGASSSLIVGDGIVLSNSGGNLTAYR